MIDKVFYGSYSNMSPGWQSKALHKASRVESFIALAFPVFSIERLACVMPIFSASSWDCIFRLASITSTLIIIGMV